MKNIYLYFLILITCQQVANAQQLPIFTQFREHHILINPAIPFVDHQMPNYYPVNYLGFSYRRQWTQLSTGPKTYSLRYDHIFDTDNIDYAAGGSILRNKTGPFSFTGGYLRGALYLNLNSKITLGFGASLGLIEHSFSFNENDLIITNTNDPALMSNLKSLNLDSNIGLYLEYEFKENILFYGGLSLNQIVTPSLLDNDELNPNRIHHYYSLVGVFFTFDNKIMFESSLWTKLVKNVPLQNDINTRIILAVETFHLWFGPSISFDFVKNEKFNSLSLEVGISFPFGNRETSRLKLGGTAQPIRNSNSQYFGSTIETNGAYTW